MVVVFGLALPKFRLMPPTRRAQVAAGGEVVLRRRVQQIAIDDEVAVAVGPAARGLPAPDPMRVTMRAAGLFEL